MPHTILIADDDPVTIKLLEFNLKKHNFSVLTSLEGLSVQPLTLSHSPSLLILDLFLPGRTGLDIIKDFKQNPSLASIPIIILTGHGKDSTRNELIQAGASTVFTKPFSPNLLINTINNLLQPSTPTT